MCSPNAALAVLCAFVLAVLCAFVGSIAGPGPASADVRGAPLSVATAEPNHDEIVLWPGGAPGELPGMTPCEVVTCLTKNVSIRECVDRLVENVTVPVLLPYLVSGADSAVIVAPGGAWKSLAIDREGTDIAAWLNSLGISAFVLKYRVRRGWGPNTTANLMDAQRATGMVRHMAATGNVRGLNMSKIGFMGFSAGGQVTGHLSVAWKRRVYARVDAADEESCRPDFAMMIYPGRVVSQPPVNQSRAFALDLNVTKETPPTMLVQAEDDHVHVENSLYYWLALKQKGAAPSELHIYPRGGHGYGRCTMPGTIRNEEVCTWPDRGEAFLKMLGVVFNGTRVARLAVHI